MKKSLIKEIQKIVKTYNIDIVLTKKGAITKRSLIRFKNIIYTTNISVYQNLSEDFIREFKDNVHWYAISMHQRLSEDFMREFKNKVDWSYISAYQKLSEGFIREFKGKVYWPHISIHQKLSEGFIREFKGYVDWYHISTYQKLSEGFIREFKDKIHWYYISKYQKLSVKFRKEFNIKPSKNNWLYKSTQRKLKYIKKNTKYKIVDDKYIIAYKAIKSDNYSVYNFQYKYEKGGIYEAHCNCNVDEQNSFGLSAWTRKGAKEYYSQGKIIRVKIAIKDIGAIVHNNAKIRCNRLEVI